MLCKAMAGGLLAALCVMSTAGCSAPGGGGPTIVGSVPVAKGRDDPFAPYQEFSTAMLRGGAIPNVTTVRLIGRRDRKTGTVTTLARVAVFYEDDVRRYYDVARNARAETLQLSVITRDFPLCSRRPCRYSEEMMVEVPDAELAAARTTGYAFKLFSRVGRESLITIPKELVAALYEGMGARDGGGAARAAAPKG